MASDLHPTAGARYVLELEGAADGSHADYRAAIYTHGALYRATARLGDDGSALVSPSGAPDELHARLATIARLVARDAARLRADGMPAWPKRVMRWRA
jgi:hypothetical protein